MQSQQMTVPFDRLVHDTGANVRKHYDPGAITEMKASILADGIIQPIAVRPPVVGDADLGGQLYRIFAGGRRFRAMSELVAEKKLPADYAVPIIVRDVDETTASALSLAENLIREDMTPADEFRAFAKLADQGQSVADIALRYGQTERYVKGRMALARLHPDILAAFEEKQIGYAAACAYTTNPDVEVQFKFFKDGGWGRGQDYQIKSAMRQAAIRAESSLAQFIGEEAYLAAGGIIHEDLFGEDVYWISGELIEGLKAAAVERRRAEYMAEGWSFFATTDELGLPGMWGLSSVSPEGSDLSVEEAERLDKIAEHLEGSDPDDDDPELRAMSEEYDRLDARSSTFTAEQKADTGIVIDLNNMDMRFGVKTGAADDDEPLGAASKQAGKAQKDPLALTQPLKDKVGETATAALKTAVASDPHRALALVAATIEHVEGFNSGECRPSRLHVERVDPYSYGGTEQKKRGIAKAFTAYVAMTPDDLLTVFASLAARSIDLTEKWLMKQSYNDDKPREGVRSDFLNAFAAEPLEGFDPEAWFLACTKPMIDAAMREITGYSATKPKKADMAREAAEKARETGWLPKPLRLAGYALKGKKAAGEKKAAAKKPAKAKKEAV